MSVLRWVFLENQPYSNSTKKYFVGGVVLVGNRLVKHVRVCRPNYFSEISHIRSKSDKHTIKKTINYVSGFFSNLDELDSKVG